MRGYFAFLPLLINKIEIQAIATTTTPATVKMTQVESFFSGVVRVVDSEAVGTSDVETDVVITGVVPVRGCVTSGVVSGGGAADSTGVVVVAGGGGTDSGVVVAAGVVVVGAGAGGVTGPIRA